jgi:spore coat-associated protein N
MLANTKILGSIVMIALMASAVGIGTYAAFGDTETSVGNSFTAGTLDLKINGVDTNVVAFDLSNMRPGNQPKNTFVLSNAGSLKGTLRISEVVLTDAENGRIDPEIEAGDTTDAKGELSSVINLRLFIDTNKDGWISAGENVFFNGKVNTLPTSFDLNQQIAAGGSVNIVALFDWWNTPIDNQAQSDSFTLDLTFALTQ